MFGKIVLLVIALAQAATPLLLYFDGFDRETGGPSPIVPANYAFSIWGVIYALSVIYAAIQFLPRANAELFSCLLMPAAFLFILSSVWLLFARFARRNGPDDHRDAGGCGHFPRSCQRGIREPVDLRPLDHARAFRSLCGLADIATFANITEIGKAQGFGFFGLTLTQWTNFALITGSVLASVIVIRARGVVSYTAAILWALSAIMVANRARGESAETLVICAIGIAVVLVATLAGARGCGWASPA